MVRRVTNSSEQDTFGCKRFLVKCPRWETKLFEVELLSFSNESPNETHWKEWFEWIVCWNIPLDNIQLEPTTEMEVDTNAEKSTAGLVL